MRVRAAAQVQDSRQIRVASLKEVSLNLQDCGGGGDEKSIRGKNCILDSIPGPRQKAWCSGKVDLVDTSEEEPTKISKKFQQVCQEEQNQINCGGGWSCSSWAGT